MNPRRGSRCQRLTQWFEYLAEQQNLENKRGEKEPEQSAEDSLIDDASQRSLRDKKMNDIE